MREDEWEQTLRQDRLGAGDRDYRPLQLFPLLFCTR
jgi:hypothetical protein